MVIALIFIFGACDWGRDGNLDRSDIDEIDWTPYNSPDDRAFIVSNNTSKDLIAFKRTISKSNILGGIPANDKGHGIKKNATLLNGNQDFAMVLITKEDYVANKDNLASLENTPFTRIYVYYNANGDNNVVYEISGRLGGNKIIEVTNPSSTLNIEIRLGGIYGETIGYAPAGQLITRLRVDEGDFNLFPVFKRYNQTRDIVETIYPIGTNNRAWFQALAFDENNTIARINLQGAITALSTRTSGVAWFVINNSTNGAIHLAIGGQPVRTSTGISYFNTGTSKTFTIEMPNVPNSTNTFAESTQISNYSVGPDTLEVDIETTAGEKTFWIKSDYQYTVYVTGDSNSADGLKAVVELDEEAANGAPVKITQTL